MIADTQVRNYHPGLIPERIERNTASHAVAGPDIRTRIVTGPLRFGVGALQASRPRQHAGQPLDESWLLELARNGQPAALGQIFNLYAPMLFGYAVRICHDKAEADQVVGDVFAQLLEHFAEGRGPRTNLRAYLYQSTYHLLIDHMRAASRSSSIEDAVNMPDSAQSVAMHVEEQELLNALNHAVQHRLTDEQRHVIMLRFVEGFSLEETARIVGKTVNAVGVLQNRAISKLRQVLKRHAPELSALVASTVSPVRLTESTHSG